tara:strand:+ start:272 stop:463 length:192 start_codon:yes stop_codon:yes gene_type:complete
MAKKQSFGDKVGKKKGTGKNHIKLIRTGRAIKSGALRFYEEMIRVPDGKNADAVVKELLEKEA